MDAKQTSARSDDLKAAHGKLRFFGLNRTRDQAGAGLPQRQFTAFSAAGPDCGTNLSDPLDRHGENISDPAFGLDQTRRVRTRFELATKAKNLHVDAAIENILVHMRRSQQILPAERALRRVEEDEQQG